MEKKRNEVEFNDIGGRIYFFFLHFMLFSQMGFFVKDVFMNEIVYCIIHLLALFYFMLRIHVFNKVKDKANSAGYSLIEYLRDKYGV